MLNCTHIPLSQDVCTASKCGHWCVCYLHKQINSNLHRRKSEAGPEPRYLRVRVPFDHKCVQYSIYVSKHHVWIYCLEIWDRQHILRIWKNKMMCGDQKKGIQEDGLPSSVQNKPEWLDIPRLDVYCLQTAACKVRTFGDNARYAVHHTKTGELARVGLPGWYCLDESESEVPDPNTNLGKYV